MSLIYIDSFTPGGIVKDGLVLHLDAAQPSSYPGSGTTWTDLSGNGRTGTLTNMEIPGDYSSANGGSLTFDGVNEYVACSGSLTTTTATFIVWIRRNGALNEWTGFIFNRGVGNVTGIGNYAFSNMIGYHWNDASNTYNWQSNLIVPDLTWCMCAVSVSGSSATAYLCQSSGITFATNTVSHSSTTMGSISIALNSGRAPFNGSISQALIYNRALSAAEITQNFNALKGRYGL